MINHAPVLAVPIRNPPRLVPLLPHRAATKQGVQRTVSTSRTTPTATRTSMVSAG
jgi:hypothetical protein